MTDPDTDLDTLRAKILVIFAAAEGEPLRIGYAARRITNEVVAPLADALAEAREREQKVRALLENWMRCKLIIFYAPAHPDDLRVALNGPQDGAT